MAPPVVAVVFVESTWVRQTGMSAVFERVPESRAPSGDVRIIFVTSYNISDSTFAEIVVYPKASWANKKSKGLLSAGTGSSTSDLSRRRAWLIDSFRLSLRYTAPNSRATH